MFFKMPLPSVDETPVNSQLGERSGLGNLPHTVSRELLRIGDQSPMMQNEWKAAEKSSGQQRGNVCQSRYSLRGLDGWISDV